ncbi:unnamed protein product [Polarella glacialis]|nr:unnamed protein product [Polarella glacialis]|eukprot:CAMPEP_0115076866 /NCGR_PEP_ID=MMETSP0227-20121206/16669_1 /TAXON_ID=89957 /ORGANISM="Polarella glacialis, Strain CCMP 1383" /LENGTH=142 /DNA_ID=CAMNT_0002464063 /DNA_START=77 /DNA_END=505 /DNA_ORIENTATION=-
MAASPDLIWACVGKSSSFIRKSVNMPTMNAEPGNLCGLNSFKYSGLANTKVINVSPVIKGKKESIVLTQGHLKASRRLRPGTMLVQSGVKKSAKKAVAAITKTIAGKFYRVDLLDQALVKYNKIKQSFKKRKLVVKSRRAQK